MRRYLSAFLLTAVLAIPAARLRANDDHDRDDREHHAARYYDSDARDYHEWNEHEEHAWRRYWEERHEAYRDWRKATRAERRAYWHWRHNHPDRD
jgi:hypothetical protein